MVVRLKEWIIPYTAWDWIDISDNHVISVLLREANNLIHINEDREMYVDLQLDDGIEPTDDFPVWVTTGRILAEDWWDQNWIILNWKTTSGDYVRLIYAADWKLYYDPGTGVWNEIWGWGGSCDCNVKLFSLSWASDLTTAQAILDWQKGWKDAIVAYDNEIYMFKTYRVVTQTPAVWLSYNKIVRDWVSQGYTETVAKAIEINYDPANNNTVSSIFFDEYKVTNASIDPTSQYNSAFVPTQPYHPATKAYVDQMVSWVYIYKWSVSTYSDLANIQNPEVWDVYNVVDSGMNYAWTGTDWDALGWTINYTAWDWIWINNWVISNTKPGATVSSTAPSNPSEWDLWYDTTNDVLKSYDGTNWNTIWSWGWGWSYSWWKNIDITNSVINLKLIDVNVSSSRTTTNKVGTTTAWNYSPTKWDLLLVNFAYWNSTSSLTLNIDGSWAKDVRVIADSPEVTTTLGMVGNDQKVLVYYDGTYYRTRSLHNNYAVMTTNEMEAWTSPVGKNISPALLKSAVEYWWGDMKYSDFNWVTASWSAVTMDMSTQITPTENFTVTAPSTIKEWQTYILRVTNGATAYTMTLGTWITNPSSASTTLTANSTDQFVFLWVGWNLELQASWWWASYGTATSSTEWVIKLGSDTVQSVAANSPSSTASRTYPVQLNSSGQAVVNVPWTDSWGGWGWSYSAWDWINISSGNVISNTMYPTNQATGNVGDILTKSASGTVWLDSSLLYNVKAWNVSWASSSTLQAIITWVNKGNDYSAILKLGENTYIYGSSSTSGSTTTYIFPSVEKKKNADSTWGPASGYTTIYQWAYKIEVTGSTYTGTVVNDWSNLANVIEPTGVPYAGYFTPTADYHPATKKYVDDAVAWGGGWGWITNNTTGTTTTVSQIWAGTETEYGNLASYSNSIIYFTY